MGQDVSKLAAHAGGKIKNALDRAGVSLIERLIARREREEECRRERAERAGWAGRRGERRRGERYVFLLFSFLLLSLRMLGCWEGAGAWSVM